MPSDPDNSYEVASEQYFWWRDQGLSHAEMLQALGITPPSWPVGAEVVVRQLARAHRNLLALKRAAA